MAYDSTSVPVERSQGAIRDLLRKFGAKGFSFNEARAKDVEGAEKRIAMVEFLHSDQHVRILVALKMPDPALIHAKSRRARVKTYEVILDEEMAQEERRIWRVLFHTIKARMVAVEEKVETFEEAFLAHLVDPATNRTLYQTMRPALDAGAFRVGGEGLRALPQSGDPEILEADDE